MTTPAEPQWIAGRRFEDAALYAIRTHARQARKGGSIPYLAHLFAVAALVMEQGGSEHETIAALLHDAGEDQGGEPRMRDIKDRFGPEVEAIVRGCSDTLETPKQDRGLRMRAYVEHLPTATAAVRRVSLADKVHNAESIAGDYAIHGEELWKRFNATRDEIAEYYRGLCAAFRAAGDQSPLLTRLETTVRQLFGN